MAIVYEIEHITSYKYANPVRLGEHRAMFLPRGSHSGRILSYSVETNVPSKVHWIMDTLSNNVAAVEFTEPTTELTLTCRFQGMHFGTKGIGDFPLDPRAQEVPVQYTPDEWIDLSAYLRPHAEDLDGSVAVWAKSFVAGDRDGTINVLNRIMDTIRDSFTYRAREEEGTQTPGQTLSTRSGTCRDYAWLMIETLRRLGFACRFVSGYLYDAALDGGDIGMTGSGATHAWLSVFLPGAGWLDYDPTNRITEGFDLIPVAIARHPGQAIPLVGSWFGDASDYLGMDVKVSFSKQADYPDLQ
ncbi:MAG: transglutaminase domain-containing protein [Leptolyngbyaceae cyanobacterium]